MTLSRLPRSAFTLVELLVAMAIIGILMALSASAILAARESANRIQCQNNIRQLGLATHGFHGDHGRFPPGIGSLGTSYGNVFFHLLPYVEQKGLYELADGDPSNNKVYEQPVPIYFCPSDPVAGGKGWATDNDGKKYGAGNYAGNVLIFCTVADGTWQFQSPYGEFRLDASCSDGTSNTMLFAEHYAHCKGKNYPEGGSFWAYDKTGRVWPLHPAFAISWNEYSVGPEKTFQDRPSPNYCDPTYPSTPHRGVIHVGMVDTSIKSVSAGVSPASWWAAVTPRNNDIAGEDF